MERQRDKQKKYTNISIQKNADSHDYQRTGRTFKKTDDDIVQPLEQVRIRLLDEFFDAQAQSHLINISRTPKGLAITRPDRHETRATIQTLTSLSGLQQRSKIQTLDNVNSLMMGPDDRLYNMLTQEGFRDLMKAEDTMQEKAKQKPISCNCKKTHCLKMYCECISKNMYCNSECQCRDCHNNSIHESQRQKSKQKMIVRKGPSSKQQFLDHEDYPAQKSCNCKKSGCNKKYCECFGGGNKCTSACKCTSCKNKIEEERQKVVEDEQPINYTLMHYEEANQYHQNHNQISNGFHLGQLQEESMRNRSMFGLREEDSRPGQKMFTFANIIHNSTKE